MSDHGLAQASPVPHRVQIVEVGPRDGLQNDPAILDATTKAAFIQRCLDAGASRIEAASFVNPARVPQMADAEAVLELLRPDGRVPDGASLIGLVLNERGYERARLTPIDEVNLVVMVTDEFSQRNQGMSTQDAVDVVRTVAPAALDDGFVPTVTLSASFGCPFTGEVPVERLAEVVAQVADTGVTEVAIADTIGVAVPADVRERVQAARRVLAETGNGEVSLRAHFHNTRNTGYANALAAYEAGVGVLDASVGGVGGCPFAPRATGNIATEDLVYALERSGVRTGLDLAALIETSEWLGEQLGRPTPSLVSRAGDFPAAS